MILEHQTTFLIKFCQSPPVAASIQLAKSYSAPKSFLVALKRCPRENLDGDGLDQFTKDLVQRFDQFATSSRVLRCEDEQL
eukprot:750903-Hanusia_phi.AAC.2